MVHLLSLPNGKLIVRVHLGYRSIARAPYYLIPKQKITSTKVIQLSEVYSKKCQGAHLRILHNRHADIIESM
jgi:hypothetical protein